MSGITPFRSMMTGSLRTIKIRTVPATSLQAEMCRSGLLNDDQGIIDPRKTK